MLRAYPKSSLQFLVYGTIDLFDKAKCLYTIYHEISLISEISGIDSSYEIPDELWNQIFPLLVINPKERRRRRRQVVQEWMIERQ